MDINSIAKLAGVSRATVSRYLNDGYVSAEKRKVIARVIKETGYVPSQQAQTLRTGKTNIVGVILPKVNSHAVSRMLSGMTLEFNDAHYQTLLANTNNNKDTARSTRYACPSSSSARTWRAAPPSSTTTTAPCSSCAERCFQTAPTPRTSA